MKLHIWVTDEPLSDDADGDQKIYVDYTCVIGNNLHEARQLVLQLADLVHRELLLSTSPPMPVARKVDPDPQEPSP